MTYVYTGLKPNTKYYLDIKGFWTLDVWKLDSSFTTKADTSVDTSSRTGS
jgi:hypothetical protein